jgi:nucleotide-binding universal stress UspA family protein
MYETIHVPVDNSDHSDASIDLAVALGRTFSSKLVGSHVYAAQLHDVRFKQMEFTLPDEYKEEEELEKQRKIHDALIGRGLHLISDSYLDQMETRCVAAELAFERKHFDGKNFEAIVADVNAGGYDLLVLGALGMGAVKASRLGSVCERVLRRCPVDTLVVRDTDLRDPAQHDGALLTFLDGSEGAHGAAERAFSLASKLGKAVLVVAIAGDDAEADVLELHLEASRRLGERRGVDVSTQLRRGAARDEMLAACREVAPWLVVAGRKGSDAPETEAPLGTTVEHLLRHGSWNVLVTAHELAIAEALDVEDAA